MSGQERCKRHPFFALPLRVSRPECKNLLRTQTRVAVVAAYVLTALAYLWPADYRNEAAWFVVIFWLAFMLRTFLFHRTPGAQKNPRRCHPAGGQDGLWEGCLGLRTL